MFRKILFSIVLAALATSLASAQPNKKRILAIGQSNGFQHDAVSDGLATLYRLGKETGLWDTYIRTDAQLITKKKLQGNAKNLDYFDAVFFYTTGELSMDDEQKADLIKFVKEDGKGFLGSHSAIDTFYKWPEYGEMVGAYFDGHPWNQFQAPVIVEDRNFPATKHLPERFSIMDEIYQPKSFSRDRVRVLMRMDPDQIDLTRRGVNRKDKDFALTWIRDYGKGRVFYSTFGHRTEVWERADIRQMWIEAAKWVLKLTDGDASPRPKP